MVPPQAAERVPLRKSSAIFSPSGIGWSRWQCASTPPGSTRLAAGVDLALAGRQALAERHDAAAGDADVALHHVAGGGHGAVADDGVEALHVEPPRQVVAHDRRPLPASLRLMCAVSRAAQAATAMAAQTTAR